MSELRANTISDAAGTGPVTLTGQYAAKAWVNFNGTGTVAIRESGNVSSITDNGTGNYTVNFTNAITDANFSAVASGSTGSITTSIRNATTGTGTTTTVPVGMRDTTNTQQDAALMCVAVTR